jgi:hypothetical protein
MDLVVARLDSVPLGAQLTFSYGPTTEVYLAWVLSALSLAGLVAWLVRPAWFARLPKFVVMASSRARLPLAARIRWREDDG